MNQYDVVVNIKGLMGTHMDSCGLIWTQCQWKHNVILRVQPIVLNLKLLLRPQKTKAFSFYLNTSFKHLKAQCIHKSVIVA